MTDGSQDTNKVVTHSSRKLLREKYLGLALSKNVPYEPLEGDGRFLRKIIAWEEFNHY